MANSAERLPMVLTSYGIPHVMGYLATKDGLKHPQPLSFIGLMDAAVEMGLTGIEIPIPDTPNFAWEPLKAALDERQLSIVADYMVLAEQDLEACKRVLQYAQKLGAKVFRACLSNILCGDRREYPGGWASGLKKNASRLNELLPLAADLGLCIAVENHQDASSEDLLQLAEMVKHHKAFGVTLDTGNPLAVGEGPVEFAREIAPLIRHVHCKDYTMHYAFEGYRLVRCVAGTGVIPFAEILNIVKSNGHAVTLGVEIAAQATRTIPIFQQSWWTTYSKPHAHKFPDVVRLLVKKGFPPEHPYSSAWERGENSAIVSAEEWKVLRESVGYFRGL